ncbi:MAG TPA: sigma-70 family RNA polymerase sigma factor [Candidatus Monoglobus merdigallinarum]|uniref:Sigma-70 family RNA polymerase sigma factor n=1 Tax=Candidatus Monoglobus merdigallinarum TaxID=2838698 RepID=A0A9D1PRP0_9FIRM|nr:sigma-70 family RNA polymerase sigma factor [Candidatus Monoglobus merdigallinarum]
MKKLSVRPADSEIEDVVNKYSGMLFKLCFTVLYSNADAEDAVSDTFLRYITRSPEFADEEHKKAWLIRVAVNICKDMCRFRKKHGCESLDEAIGYCADQSEINILEEIMRLPAKYKTVIHLFYIEGYKTAEIAEILSISKSAVRKRLQYARGLLKIECERSF